MTLNPVRIARHEWSLLRIHATLRASLYRWLVPCSLFAILVIMLLAGMLYAYVFARLRTRKALRDLEPRQASSGTFRSH